MRPLEILLVLGDAATLGALIWRRRLGVRWALILGLSAIAVAIIHGVAEGPRWQMGPAYALTGLFLLIAGAAALPSDRARPWPQPARVALGALGACAVASAAAPPLALPVFSFPAPSGPFAIGTVTYYWIDISRPERFTAAPDDRRELMVQVWYPAAPAAHAPRARYVEDGAALASLAHLMQLPGFVFSHLPLVRTHAVSAAPALPGAHPVLIFLHGRGGFRQHDTLLTEHLVSHGYIVAAIDQPYAAAGVVFPGGRVVAMDPGMRDRRVVDAMIPYLAQDVGYALDRLAALNRADPQHLLAGRLDLQHVGVFGVSLGAMVGPEACLRDARLRACLAIDGPMPADVVAGVLRQPVMWISRPPEFMRQEGWSQRDIHELPTSMRQVFDRLPGQGYIVLIPGMFHVNFSDFPLMVARPVAARLGFIGPIDPDRGLDIVNAYALAFFDRTLRGAPAGLLDAPHSPYPEVQVERRRP